MHMPWEESAVLHVAGCAAHHPLVQHRKSATCHSEMVIIAAEQCTEVVVVAEKARQHILCHCAFVCAGRSSVAC